MKKIKYVLFIVCLMVLCTGCKKKESVIPTETVSPVPTASVQETPVTKEEENHDGEVKSKLTGLWVKEEISKKRPYAIMFNNIKVASPQSGTSEADILYEAIVEGGITRMMGIFENITSDRIGSVRSARHYFVSFADEYDAIFVHYGQTKYAVSKILELGIDTLSGLSGEGTTVFYRDKSIKAPHNAFASKEGILTGTENKKYRTEYREDFDGHFKFYGEDTDLNSSENAEKVTLKFSSYTAPYFIYNDSDKQYYRYQFNDKHIDYNTKEQLHFKNIIVQFVKEWNIDKKGYQTMDIENSSGTGYYITNGKKVDITWEKNESNKSMHYYDSNGNELVINPGKTYIAVFPKDRTSDIVLSENQ